MRAHWPFYLAISLAAGFSLSSSLGCRRESAPDAAQAAAKHSDSVDPLTQLRRAILKQDWRAADEHSSAVLIQHGTDPKVIAEVARVKHSKGEFGVAADLLVTAAEQNNLADLRRSRQAVAGLLDAGRLVDAMELLSRVITIHPDDVSSKRLLCQLLHGVLRGDEAKPLEQAIVRAREFTMEDLVLMLGSRRWDIEMGPMKRMVQRHPADPRPLIGEARQSFDRLQCRDAEATLRRILAVYPDDAYAGVLLGRTVFQDPKRDEATRRIDLANWLADGRPNWQTHPEFWLLLSFIAETVDRVEMVEAAARIAASMNTDDALIWQRYHRATSMLAARNGGSASDPDSRVGAAINNAIGRRAASLQLLQQRRDEFVVANERSVPIALEIAKILDSLGRCWESEAWASIAMTLPADDDAAIGSALQDFRQGVVRRLWRDLPWQVTDGREELVFDVGPSIKRDCLAAVRELASPSSTVADEDPLRVRDDRHEPTRSLGARQPILLVNEATSRGLDFAGWTSDQNDRPGIPIYRTLGCGGGTIDYDLDGFHDLVLTAAGGKPPTSDSQPNELFRNFNGRFVAVGSLAGCDDRRFAQGVAVGDRNEDGFPDVWVLNFGQNQWLINQGDGTFREVDVVDVVANPASAAADDPLRQWSSSGAIADVNLDGLADAIEINYCDSSEVVTAVCGGRISDDRVADASAIDNPADRHDVSGAISSPHASADPSTHRSCAPVRFPAAENVWWIADPAGQMIDHHAIWNMAPDVPGRGLGLVVGRLRTAMGPPAGLDVFIANDMSDNFFWTLPRSVSDPSDVAGDGGPPRGLERASALGLAADQRGRVQGSMGIAVGDLDLNGETDLYVTNFEGETNAFVRQDRGFFQDLGTAFGLDVGTRPLVGFGVQAIDLTNVGELDVVVTNGHVDFNDDIDPESRYDQPMQVFRRGEQGRFDVVPTDRLGSGDDDDYASRLHCGRALWTCDVDADGRLDICVTHQAEPVALLVNRSSPRPSITIRLVGRSSSRDAVGATVTVTGADWRRTLHRFAGSGYLCSNAPELHFGLGDQSGPIELQIQWPDGSTQIATIQNVSATHNPYVWVQGEMPFQLR